MWKEHIKEYLQTVITALFISWLLITFVVQAFYIPSGSMRPTFQIGDRIFVNKFIYRFRDPKRQEMVVFKYPVNPEHKFIKRVIGLPGDTIKIKDGQVYVNDKLLKEPYLKEKAYGDYREVKIPPDNYFVLGDNRNNSQDSRYWGFVPRENIVGTPFLIFWPLDRIKWLGVKKSEYSMVSPSHG